MTPRLRRLTADHDKIKNAFENHPFISILETEGDPPEKYTVEFNLEGMVPEKNGDLVRKQKHRAEVFLSIDYPRRPPFCRMITPVFHPNIDPQKICIGDHWSAGESLVHLIVRIGEMICYQSYNVKSPLNGNAAAWVEKNVKTLPLMEGEISV